MKLLSDYPLISLHFIRTTENLADYLTRQGLPKGDLEKLSLIDIEIKDFYSNLTKSDFTLSEWAKFCADNPHYLTVSTPTVNSLTFTVSQGIANIKDITGPLDLLKDKLAREQIIKHQKVDFKDLYNDCLSSPNFEVKTDKDQYQINFYLLMINKDGYKILVPDNLIGPLLA